MSSNLYTLGTGTISSNKFPSSPIIQTRPPATTDIQGDSGPFPLGKVWVDKVGNQTYFLTSLTSSSGVTVGTWTPNGSGSGSLTTLSGQSGTASPSAGNIIISGASGITTSASGNTVTITGSGATGITQVTGNAGTAVTPSGGNINVVGASNTIVGTGSGSTLTFTIAPEIQSSSLNVLSGTSSPAGLTAVGFGSGSGVNVTAVGFQALNANTGAQNTAFGYEALLLNTSGTQNVAVGFQASEDNITGSRNTSVGFQAGQAGTSSDTTAIGYQALENSTVTGTAVGSGALSANVSGGSNTAVGFNALHLATSSTNTAVGNNALVGLTSGNQCTAVGASALQNISTNSSCDAFGVQALRNATGSFNTAFGTQALTGITTGTQNVAMGFQAMQSVTTGSQNVAIGWLAGNGYTTSDSNNISIGPNSGSGGVSNSTFIGSASQTSCNIGGIRGATTPTNNAIAVLIDSNGFLGTVSSSIRFKENVKDMGDVSSPIFKLRPVTFNYIGKADRSLGLIAEEVSYVMPELVVHDRNGDIESVKYHDLIPLLLNEVHKLRAQVDQLMQGK